jgi:hypothetical protein
VNLNEIKDPRLRKRIIQADAVQNHRLAQSPVSKPDCQNGAVESNAGKTPYTSCCFARITLRCFRVRSLDDDNPYPKYFVDSLRYAGAIFDDSKNWAQIKVIEQLVEHYWQERTEIEVAYGPIIPDTSGD